MSPESDPDRRKGGRHRGTLQPVRPRREGVGRALNAIFAFKGEVIPIDLERLLTQLDDPER
jgi:hypothetical protein